MTTERTDGGVTSEEFQGISSLRVSRLLELGLSREREPIDGLVARLRASEGADWLRKAIESGGIGSRADWESIASPAGAPTSLLRAIKDRANDLLRDPADQDAFHAGMAGYFIAIAAGLAQHGELLTRQPREKLEPILRKLSEVAPSPWAPLFRRALDSLKTKARGEKGSG